MPVNIVKTKADEKDWERARRVVDKEYPDKKPDDKDKSYWKLTTHIYENMKKGDKRKPDVKKEASTLTNTLLGSLLGGGLGMFGGHLMDNAFSSAEKLAFDEGGKAFRDNIRHAPRAGESNNPISELFSLNAEKSIQDLVPADSDAHHRSKLYPYGGRRRGLMLVSGGGLLGALLGGSLANAVSHNTDSREMIKRAAALLVKKSGDAEPETNEEVGEKNPLGYDTTVPEGEKLEPAPNTGKLEKAAMHDGCSCKDKENDDHDNDHEEDDDDHEEEELEKRVIVMRKAANALYLKQHSGTALGKAARTLLNIRK